jgi:ketosteroid isomerase-like protein
MTMCVRRVALHAARVKIASAEPKGDSMASTEDERQVLAVNAAFYAAFARRDVGAMEDLWATGAPVACVHPGWHALSGRGEVMASWRGILTGPGAPDIACTDATAHVVGDLAYVLCTEQLPGGLLVATNVFVREGAAWKLLHHHAGPIALDDDDDERPPSGRLH